MQIDLLFFFVKIIQTKRIDYNKTYYVCINVIVFDTVKSILGEKRLTYKFSYSGKFIQL